MNPKPTEPISLDRAQLVAVRYELETAYAVQNAMARDLLVLSAQCAELQMERDIARKALWMRAPSEDLDDNPPSEWLRAGGDPQRVIEMARQVASSWSA